RAKATICTPSGYFAASSVPAINAVGQQHVTPSGGTAGGQVGYNWQSGVVVYGVEADIEWLGLSGTATGSAVYPCCAPTSFTVSSSMKSDWLFTLRPRLGFAANKWLLFRTGGPPVADLQGHFLFPT